MTCCKWQLKSREVCSLAGRKQPLPRYPLPAETAGTEVGSAVSIWLVMRMEDGLDWQDAHMGSREIIVGGGRGRGLITEPGTILAAWCAVQPPPLQLSLGFPSMLTQAQDQVTRIRWYQSCICAGTCGLCRGS